MNTEAGPIQRTELNARAAQADAAEHEESAWQSVKKHRRAVFWAFAVSLCVIMEGYDTILLGNFMAYPAFTKKFGTWDTADGTNQVSAPWQAGIGDASGIGAFFGALLNGFLVNRFGQKRVLLCSLVTISAFIFIVFFAPNMTVLTVGEMLCGFPWGIFATLSPAYASEVLPLKLRVYMTSWTNMCFISGQLIAAGVMKGMVDNDTEWSYKVCSGPLFVYTYTCRMSNMVYFCVLIYACPEGASLGRWLTHLRPTRSLLPSNGPGRAFSSHCSASPRSPPGISCARDR